MAKLTLVFLLLSSLAFADYQSLQTGHLFVGNSSNKPQDSGQLLVGQGNAANIATFISTDPNGIFTRYQDGSTVVGSIGDAKQLVSGSTLNDFAIQTPATLYLAAGGTSPAVKIDTSGMSTFLGHVGVGTGALGSVGLYLDTIINTGGGTEYGAYFGPNYASATNLIGVQATVNLGASGAATNVYTHYVSNPSKGSGATMTNAYGVYIEAITSGSTINDAIHVVGGNTYLGGTLTAPNLAASSAPTTGSMCWTTGTGNVNIDTTLACLASSRKIKEKISPLDIGLKTVLALKPVEYQLRKEFNPMKLGKQVGLIAEEVGAIDERLVGKNAKGEIIGVRYMQLTAVLVKAIQEQNAVISDLQNRVAALEK